MVGASPEPIGPAQIPLAAPPSVRQLQLQPSIQSALNLTGQPLAAGPEGEQTGQIQAPGVQLKAPAGALPVASGREGETTVPGSGLATGGEGGLTGRPQLLLIKAHLGPAPQMQRGGRGGQQAQIEWIPEAHLQPETGSRSAATATEGPERSPGQGAENQLPAGDRQAQHRHPLLQAGQGIETDHEAAHTSPGVIQPRRADRARTDRHPQAAQAAVGPEVQGVAKALTELTLQQGFPEQNLAFDLAVENHATTDQGQEGQGQAPDQPMAGAAWPRRGWLIRSVCLHLRADRAGGGRNIGTFNALESPMPADPLLLLAGRWLGISSALLTLVTIAAFVRRWGVRFRLVGITSFTVLLALSCTAFAISYSPRVAIPGAVVLPVVYDNGADLVVAAAPPDLPEAAILPSLEQISRNLRGSGRQTSDGLVHVRVRQIRSLEPGRSQPVVIAEATRNLRDGSVQLADQPGQAAARRS